MKLEQITYNPKQRLQKVLETLKSEFNIDLDLADVKSLKMLEQKAKTAIREVKLKESFNVQIKSPKVICSYLILEAIKLGINEKWSGEHKTNPKKKGMFDGWTIAKLKAARSRLKNKESRTAAESTKLKEINYAIRAKSGWGKVTESTEIEKAEVLLASKNIVDELQKQIENVSKTQVESLPPIIDRIKVEYSVEKAENYRNEASMLLQNVMDHLNAAKEGIDNLTLGLSGDIDMGSSSHNEEPVEKPEADFGPEAEETPKELQKPEEPVNPEGRERKEESVKKNINKKLAEDVVNIKDYSKKKSSLKHSQSVKPKEDDFKEEKCKTCGKDQTDCICESKDMCPKCHKSPCVCKTKMNECWNISIGKQRFKVSAKSLKEAVTKVKNHYVKKNKLTEWSDKFKIVGKRIVESSDSTSMQKFKIEVYNKHLGGHLKDEVYKIDATSKEEAIKKAKEKAIKSHGGTETQWQVNKCTIIKPSSGKKMEVKESTHPNVFRSIAKKIIAMKDLKKFKEVLDSLGIASDHITATGAVDYDNLIGSLKVAPDWIIRDLESKFGVGQYNESMMVPPVHPAHAVRYQKKKITPPKPKVKTNEKPIDNKENDKRLKEDANLEHGYGKDFAVVAWFANDKKVKINVKAKTEEDAKQRAREHVTKYNKNRRNKLKLISLKVHALTESHQDANYLEPRQRMNHIKDRELQKYSHSDFLDMAHGHLSHAAIEELEEILDGDWYEAQSSNLLKQIEEFARKKGEIKLADDINSYLSSLQIDPEVDESSSDEIPSAHEDEMGTHYDTDEEQLLFDGDKTGEDNEHLLPLAKKITSLDDEEYHKIAKQIGVDSAEHATLDQITAALSSTTKATIQQLEQELGIHDLTEESPLSGTHENCKLLRYDRDDFLHLIKSSLGDQSAKYAKNVLQNGHCNGCPENVLKYILNFADRRGEKNLATCIKHHLYGQETIDESPVAAIPPEGRVRKNPELDESKVKKRVALVIESKKGIKKEKIFENSILAKQWLSKNGSLIKSVKVKK